MSAPGDATLPDAPPERPTQPIERSTGALSAGVAVLPRATAELPSRPRYEPKKMLGEGSFGEVSLAMDNDIDRPVAIKRVRQDVVNADTIARFVAEVQVVGRLEHPGIVPIHDVGLDDSGYFFVMKYVDGETLESVIEGLRARKPEHVAKYSMEHRTQLFLQLCRAVQFAHARSILHLDIKPANVMVGPFGEVMLMDWGMAKKLGSTEGPTCEPGLVFGTPKYMSPEQARGENDRTDQRSDLYALCALFYELLTLEHYLTAKSDVDELLRAVVSEAPLGPIAVHHRYGVPPELCWLVAKGLSKDPAQRYQTAAELCDRIQATIEGQAPVQCPCTGLKRAGGLFGDFIDRHPIGAIGAATAVGALSLVGLATVIGAVL